MNSNTGKWGVFPPICGLVFLVCAFANPARAEKQTLILPAPEPMYYLAIAPSAALSYRDSEYDSSLGGELHLLRNAQAQRWSILGLSVGATKFAAYDATRLHLDFYAGFRTLHDVPIGFALGPVVDIFRVGRTNVGFRSTVWAYAGISPFLRLTSTQGLSSPDNVEVEVGLTIPIPAFRW